MKTPILCFSLMFGTTALAVDDLKIYSSELNKFSLQMPSGWEMIEQKKEDVTNPVNIEIVAPENLASVLVMVPKDGKPSCAETLRAMDDSRKKKNLVKPDQSKITKDILTAAKAEEGAVGEYLIEGKGPGFPVVQKSYCFKSKDQIRIVTVAYQKAKGARFEPLFKKVISSFQFNP